MTSLLFDENIPNSIVEGLRTLVKSDDIDIRSTTQITQLGKGASDSMILSYAKSLPKNTIIVTNDKDFKKRQLLSQIMKSKALGLFLLKFPNGSNYWRRAVFVINHWEKMEEYCRDSKFPFSYQVAFKNKFVKI